MKSCLNCGKELESFNTLCKDPNCYWITRIFTKKDFTQKESGTIQFITKQKKILTLITWKMESQGEKTIISFPPIFFEDLKDIFKPKLKEAIILYFKNPKKRTVQQKKNMFSNIKNINMRSLLKKYRDLETRIIATGYIKFIDQEGGLELLPESILDLMKKKLSFLYDGT